MLWKQFSTCLACPIGPYMTLNQTKTHPKNAMSGVDFGVIPSTIFVQTLSYMTQLRVYIIRRQQYAMVTVVNTCDNSDRLKYDPQPGKKHPK